MDIANVPVHLFLSALFSSFTIGRGELLLLPVSVTKLNGSLSSCEFPDALKLTIGATDAAPVFPRLLVLYRNDVIDTDVMTYVVTQHVGSGMSFEPLGNAKQDSASYHNHEHGATFILSCSGGRTEIEGSLLAAGRRYRLHPPSARSPLDASPQELYQFQEEADHPTGNCVDMEHRLKYVSHNRNINPVQYSGERETRHDAHSARFRREEGGNKNYYIDVLVYLDYSFFQYWLIRTSNQSTAITEARKYVTYIFNGVNARYASADGLGFNLRIQLSSIIVSLKPEDSPWVERNKQPAGSTTLLNSTKTLDEISAFVKTNYSTIPDHDHFMLITGYDLYGTDNGFRFNNTAGFAYIGTTCLRDGSSVSIVEDHGGYQSESTVAHELGHSLGAYHDGFNNSCTSSDRYIMSGGYFAETEATKRNPWLLSNCSQTQIAEYMAELATNGFEPSCLLKRFNPQNVSETSGLPGLLVGPDEQCRQIYGPQSYLCRGSKFGKPEDICHSMYCLYPGTSNCTTNTAAPGTCCGTGKWCFTGQCVSSSNASSCYTNTTCPFGQRQGVVTRDNRTCNQLESALCYDGISRDICCEMCDKAYTNRLGCEFGDKDLGCASSYCGGRLPSGELYDVRCCGTCAFQVTTLLPPTVVTIPIPVEIGGEPSSCLNTALVDNVTCDQRLAVKASDKAYCCQSKISKSCCKTCQSLRSSDETCLFGDCQLCGGLQNKTTPCDSQQRVNCCQTCQDVDRRLAAVPTTLRTVPTTRALLTSTARTTAVVSSCKEVPGVIACSSCRLKPGNVLLLLLLLTVVTRLVKQQMFPCPRPQTMKQ